MIASSALAADTTTALLNAAYTGDTATVQTLLDNGVNVNTQDHDGYTALMWASNKGHTETAKVLLNRGADWLDIEVKDHIIVAKNAHFSFKRSGLLRGK